MADPFLGEIRPYSFNFPPRAWAFCQGQLLPINQNQALFALLGTTYGGNGQTNFALPDLRGRVPVGEGQGPGLSDRFLGERTGTETSTLSMGELPAHSHSVQSGGAAESPNPVGNFPGALVGHHVYSPEGEGAFAPDTIGSAGGSQPHSNMQPYIVVNYAIALQGIFPSHS